MRIKLSAIALVLLTATAVSAGDVGEATEHSYKWLNETEARIKKELTAKGMQITDPADGEKEWISKASTAVWPKFYDSIGGKDKLDKILKTLGR